MDELTIGVISCSGEEYFGGTIAHQATRKVLEDLRFGAAVTICLPLFVAGGEEERNFAQNHPVIAVDACNKQCAKRATEKYSGKVDATVNLVDILDEDVCLGAPLSTRNMTDEHIAMIDKVADAIVVEFDKILAEHGIEY